ncbi:glycosyltransferase family 4 protein [Neobacillus niacini]|uniref:glycosyltransferase family 4 protein n=1 Tax=Neobacillus niacini TaxID=86668 RepID=UPI001C8DEF25|nr:glycosyltransferase family 4 protein [Neobacillus niacini]MBY0145118.1 glycosyltransferase family 4 protein [Neobacillus niacini]
MQKVITIGKLYERNKLNGPGNVIYHLEKSFSRLNVDFECILKNESTSFVRLIQDIVTKVLFKKDLVVNVHTDGFIMVLIVYLVSLFNRTNTYYLTVHGIYKIDSTISGISKSRYLMLEKFLYKKFNNIICVSYKLANDINSIYGRSKNVYVINNGVQANPLDATKENIIDSDKVKLIFVGGIKRGKGILETIKAVKYIIDNSDLNIHLDIYGSVENEKIMEEYKRYLTYNKLENHVTYHGLIEDKKKLFSYYAQSTLQLCLSLYDTFNVAVLESMAVGCPCIVSDCCGAKDIIRDGENGYIVSLDKGTGTTILDILQEVLHDKNKLQQLSKYSITTAKNNTWDMVAKKYYNLFNENYDG